MGLNETASADRLHIGFFGKRNAGKSSLVNAITGQELSVVSDVLGTTTDPVRKAMELLPLGPVVIIDTPGLDDEGALGELRVKKARQILNLVDIAVIAVDCAVGVGKEERELCELLEKKNIPYVIAYNKSDLLAEKRAGSEREIYVSALTGEGVNELKEKIGSLVQNAEDQKKIVSDLIERGDTVVLVVPIDKAAPKGRLILPQQQTIRDILDAGAFALVCRDTELDELLSKLPEAPRMVITDSQAFGKVSKIVPKNVELTSFSILFARYKGDLREAVRGAAMLDRLKDGDRVLISEGCTHHRQCGDIGTVKLPAWIKGYTNKNIEFEFTSGRDFPEDLSKYSLVIHCGGCMLTEREMQYRARHAADSGVPMTNYGIVIAHTHGILRRSLEPFADILSELD
ncbi:MAG: [FeFe] hydrogenase H-cluster maturation GTPase HydF [Ruminococcaceae bacterium]|nr:[FeFe] hydrogenase H-cluster maturation GTPase HydF [Oscillospiraceae bacterium]